MPKIKTPTKPKFVAPKEDALEIKRFENRIRTKALAMRINQDVVYLKDFHMYEVQLASEQYSAIQDTYTFKFEESAKHCIALAKKMLV